MRLVAEDLEGRRGARTLFGPLNFTLEPGGALLLRGANGTGKSTLLRILAGLLAPSAGRVKLDGASLAGGVHYLSTDNAMKGALTVSENLRFWHGFLAAQGEDEAESGGLEVEAALDRVGLAQAAGLPFAALSTGQRRRVALARLLLHRRPLWLLDEPGSGLDKASQRRLSGLIGAHRAAGGTVAAAVHDDPGLPDAAVLTLGETPREAPSP